MSDIKAEMIPPQEEGAETNTEHRTELPDKGAAVELYEQAKARLLNVNRWEDLCGTGSANFQLTDAQGKDVERNAQEDDHFKIDIPGPGSVTGEGYDWVRIERIEEKKENDVDSIVITVRPASNPTGGGDDVAHFFSDAATSNFMLSREGNVVTAAVYGRNEKPNTSAEKVVDKARNAMVAISAMAGISKVQWGKLVKGIIEGH